MKSWSSALFPLIVMLTLTALTFWLRYATQLPEERADGKFRHDPDYIITDSTLRKMDENGVLNYVVKAAEIRHYPDDETTEMQKPDVVYFKPGQPTLTLRAERGRSNRHNEQIDLYENVRIYREASAKDPQMTVTTEALTVLPDEERAFTALPVRLTRGDSWATGVGMQVDNRARTYVLESQARASVESKFAPKKKP